MPATHDFTRQHAQWVDPLSAGFRGRDVLQLAPNSQGVVALQALGILDGLDLAKMSPADRMHHEIEALRIAFAFAIDAPRFRVLMTNDEVELDADVPDDVQRDLVARGHRLGDPKDFKGAAQMVRLHRGEAGVGPCLESGVDHRLDGVALGW